MNTMRKMTRRVAALVCGSALTAGAVAALAQVPGGNPPPAPGTPPAAPGKAAPPAAGSPPPAAPGTPPGMGSVPPPTGVAPPPGSTAPPGASLPPPKPEPRPTGTAATVNGQPIPEVAVYRALRQFPPAHQPMARKEIIAHLVENMLIDQYLVAIKTTVEEKDVEALINELKEELRKAGKDYAKELEAMLLTQEEFRAEVVAQMKWEKFVKQQGNDAELKKLFDSSPDMFDGSMVRARHILMTPGTDQAKQQEAAGKLRGIKQAVEQEGAKAVAAMPANADPLQKEQVRVKTIEDLFARYATEHSACPSKRDGGDLNFFPRAGAMVEPFAKAAFGMQVGQISDVVATDFGYHIILVTARKPGTQKKFDEVKEDVRMLYAMRLREAVIAQMKPNAKIAISEPPPAPAAGTPGAPPAPGAGAPGGTPPAPGAGAPPAPGAGAPPAPGAGAPPAPGAGAPPAPGAGAPPAPGAPPAAGTPGTPPPGLPAAPGAGVPGAPPAGAGAPPAAPPGVPTLPPGGTPPKM
jgi:parvulin-like peptidyl-prolyl isomerase